jgi:hypothetical protein
MVKKGGQNESIQMNKDKTMFAFYFDSSDMMNNFENYFSIVLQQKPYDLSSKSYKNIKMFAFTNCTEYHFPPEVRE